MTTVYQKLNEIENLGFDRAEAIEILRNDELDFKSGNYRFIEVDVIDEIHIQEVTQDDYMLGCFNASFLSRFVPVSQNTIETLQEAEAYAGVGELVRETADLAALCKAYADADSYGHHFAHYDHETHELDANGYYAFCIN